MHSHRTPQGNIKWGAVAGGLYLECLKAVFYLTVVRVSLLVRHNFCLLVLRFNKKL